MIGMLRRHYERLHDQTAEPGVVEGNFHHPAEDPEKAALRDLQDKEDLQDKDEDF